MNDRPLYFNPVPTPKTVNPQKILSSLGSVIREKPVKKSEGFTLSLLPVQKNKKITKPSSEKFYRTKMCPHGRECKRRFTCTYAHTEKQLRRPFMHRKNPCALYQRGLCSLGSACRDYHGNIDLVKNYQYKQKVCELFVKGLCDKGQVCIFKHQIPSQEDNRQQGQENLQMEQQDKNEQEIECLERIQKQIQTKGSQDCSQLMKKEGSVENSLQNLNYENGNKDSVCQNVQSKELQQQKKEQAVDADYVDLADGNIVLSFD